MAKLAASLCFAIAVAVAVAAAGSLCGLFWLILRLLLISVVFLLLSFFHLDSSLLITSTQMVTYLGPAMLLPSATQSDWPGGNSATDRPAGWPTTGAG